MRIRSLAVRVVSAYLAATGMAGAVVEPRWTAEAGYTTSVRGTCTALAAGPGGRFAHAIHAGVSRAAPGSSRVLVVDGDDGTTLASGSVDVGASPLIERIAPCDGGNWAFMASAVRAGQLPVRTIGVLSSDGTSRWVQELGPVPSGSPSGDGPRLLPLAHCSIAAIEQASAADPALGIRIAVLAAADGEPRWTRLLRSGSVPAMDGFDALPVAAATAKRLLVVVVRRVDRSLFVAPLDLSTGLVDTFIATGERLATSARDIAITVADGRILLALLDAAATPNLHPLVVALRESDGALAWRHRGAALLQGAPEAVEITAVHEITARFGERLERIGRVGGLPIWSLDQPAMTRFAVAARGEVVVAARNTAAGGAAVALLRADTGGVRWRVGDASLGFRPEQLAIAGDGRTVAVAGNLEPGGGPITVAVGRGAILDGASGAIRARSPFIAEVPGTQPSGRVVDGGDVVLATGGWRPSLRLVLSVERRDAATGATIWRTDLEFDAPAWADDLAILAPTLSPDGVLGVGATAGSAAGTLEQSGIAATIDVVDGRVLWQRPLLPESADLAIAWLTLLRVEGTRSGGATLGLRADSMPPLFPLPPSTRHFVRHVAGDGATRDIADGGRSTFLAARIGSAALLREIGAERVEAWRGVALEDGSTRWSRPIGQPGDALSIVAVEDGVAIAAISRRAAGGPPDATDVVLQAFDPNTGAVAWERAVADPLPATPVALRRVDPGDWILATQRDVGRGGLAVRRISGDDGTLQWERRLPAAPGAVSTGGALPSIAGGPIALSATAAWSVADGRCRICTNRLLLLDGASGAVLAWHATLGAQSPGADGALDEPRYFAGSAVPGLVASLAVVEPGAGPRTQTLAIDPPSLAVGDLSLRLVAIDRSDVDAARLRLVVDVDYDGSVPIAAAVLRGAAGSGVSVTRTACLPSAGGACAPARHAPSLVQRLAIPDGGSVRIELLATSAEWVAEPERLVLMLEGDYRIADDGPADEVITAALPTVLADSSFE